MRFLVFIYAVNIHIPKFSHLSELEYEFDTLQDLI